MAITPVGNWASGQFNSNSGGTTAGRTSTPGDLIVVSAFTSDPGSTTISDNKGNTFTQWAAGWVNDGGGWFMSFFYVENCAGGAGHTISLATAGGNYSVLNASEYGGIATSSAKDKEAVTTGTGTSLSSGATATTTQADELVVGGGAIASGTTDTFSAGSGYTMRGHVEDGVNGGLGFLEDKIVSATGAQTATATFTGGAGQWICGVITFKAAAGGPQSATGATSVTFTPAAAGIKQFVASATAALLLAAAAAGVYQQPAIATNGVTFGATATADGGGTQAATGTTGVTFTPAALGVKLLTAAGTTSAVFTPAGVAQLVQATGGTSAVTFTPAAAAISKQAAAGTAPITFNATNDGTVVKVGQGTTGVTFTPAAAGTVFKVGAGTTGLTFGQTAAGVRSTVAAGSTGATFGASAAPLAGNLSSGSTLLRFTPAASATSKQFAVGPTAVRFFPWASPTLPAALAVVTGAPFEYALRGNKVAENPIVAQAHEQRDRDLEDYLATASVTAGADADRITALEARGNLAVARRFGMNAGPMVNTSVDFPFSAVTPVAGWVECTLALFAWSSNAAISTLLYSNTAVAVDGGAWQTPTISHALSAASAWKPLVLVHFLYPCVAGAEVQPVVRVASTGTFYINGWLAVRIYAG